MAHQANADQDDWKCDNPDCDEHASYHVRVITEGPITGERREQENGVLCHRHARDAEVFVPDRITDVELTEL